MNRLLLIALLVTLGIFAFQNQGEVGRPVELAFLKYRFAMAQGFWLLGCFVAGALVYMLVDLPRSISLRRQLSKKTKEADRAKAELAKTRAQALPPAPGNPATNNPVEPYFGLDNPLGL